MRPAKKPDGSHYWEYILLYTNACLCVSMHPTPNDSDTNWKVFSTERGEYWSSKDLPWWKSLQGYIAHRSCVLGFWFDSIRSASCYKFWEIPLWLRPFWWRPFQATTTSKRMSTTPKLTQVLRKSNGWGILLIFDRNIELGCWGSWVVSSVPWSLCDVFDAGTSTTWTSWTSP